MFPGVWGGKWQRRPRPGRCWDYKGKGKDKTMGKKVAVVTGAANGIGQASALKFAREGYAVAMIDISPALSRTEEMGGEFLSCVGDVQDETAMENFINTVIEVYGRIDVLNNNAGIVVVKPLEDTKFEEFERVAKVNIGGTFVLTKLVLPMMKQQKEGSIVNPATWVRRNMPFTGRPRGRSSRLRGRLPGRWRITTSESTP